MTKVLVVDDSALMRQEISKMLETDSTLQVVGSARDGVQALERIRQLNPDVVTLDVEMPRMNGLECLKNIMRDMPRPVIMVSALTQEGAEVTIEALEYGAFDFIQKPSGSISLDISVRARQLIDKIKAAATASRRMRRTPVPPLRAKPKPPSRLELSRPKIMLPGKLEASHIIGIGISTGGPKTLQRLLPELPGDLNCSILLVQHMPEKFTATLAKRLDQSCQMHVKEAQDGEIVERGTIYVAPGGQHMSITARNPRIRFIQIKKGYESDINRPSVDVLFHSLCDGLQQNWLGVLLTGMGSDGADGLFRLRNLGGHTLVQDEATSTLFGMPKRAIEKGAACEVLPLDKIPGRIVELYRNHKF